MILLFAYLFLALFVSFVCSIMESVLLSTPISYLIVKQEKGHTWASSFINRKNNIDKPLSAILSLNTVAHTIGAAGVGAQAVKIFGEAYFGLVSAILTILILIITEIIPKTIGARYNRNLAKISSHTINIMIWITYPLVAMSAVLTRIISKSDKEKSVSREEIAALARMGVDEGIFNQKEDKILQNILKLKNVRVKEIMTPRVVVAVADEDLELTEFQENKEYLRFSRIPVYSGNEENITGYILREHVFEHLADNQQSLKLKDLRRDIIVVPNSIPLFSIWEKLLEKKEHIALIVDEYGGLDGIVTMEDIIETILGLEIVDENDQVTDMQEYARARWKAKQAKFNLYKRLNEEK